MNRKTYLSAIGDPNNPATWSGIPYHFLQEAKRQELIESGLPLRADKLEWQVKRSIWNAKQLLKGQRLGGYQYSVSFLEELWRPWRNKLEGSRIIHCFQLYPPSLVCNSDVERWYFLDQTLHQLFSFYGDEERIGKSIAKDAILREGEGYRSATGIIMHSNWAAKSVVEDYGADPGIVHVVIPGASFELEQYQRWEADATGQQSRAIREQLRLVFVGKYWYRKGLDRLLHALSIGRERGLNATLRVIGVSPKDVPASLRCVAGVEWLGFIDKQRDATKFLRTVGDCDIGCLLSRAEAGGIAIREYNALGLIVLTTDTGGAPEHLAPGSGIIVPQIATPEEIASILLDLQHHPEKLERLRLTAWQERHSALWTGSVKQIKQITSSSAKILSA